MKQISERWARVVAVVAGIVMMSGIGLGLPVIGQAWAGFLILVALGLALRLERLLVEGRYHNNFDFFKFPDFGLAELKNKPLVPLPYKPLTTAIDFFGALNGKSQE